MSRPTIFLSYASQDSEAARRIAESLRAAGADVWFDVEGGLETGDEWDAKIRRQIKECALFLPIVSAATQARHEGYFRIEWELAAQRALGIAAGVPFILPVVIDDTREADALVPDRFRAVQWTRLRGGEVTPEAQAKLLKLWSQRTSGAPQVEATVGRGHRTPPESVEAAAAPARASAGFGDPALHARPVSRWPLVLGGVVAVTAVVALVFAWRGSKPDQPVAGVADPGPASAKPATIAAPAAPSSIPEKSVAVLPFANLSEEKANEYFSDGVSEELLNVLAKVPGLKVPARTSSFFFKGKNVPLSEIAVRLGVAYLVEGSVRRSGDRVRVTAQLIKAADGYQVWSETFTRDLKDVFAVQDEIAQVVAKELQLKLSGAPTATEALNPEAFRLYLEARQAWNLRTEEGFARAETLLEQALVIAPRFARAHAALADVWLIRAQTREETGRYAQRDAPVLRRAAEIVSRAIEMDPNSAEAYATLGNICWISWRFAEARQALERAIALNPNYATAHQWLGRVLVVTGDMGAGLSSLRLAHELDPFSSRIADNYSTQLCNAGRLEEALALADKALAVQPNAVQGLRCKAHVLAELGRSAEALAIALPLIRDGSAVLREQMAYALARAGAPAEAREVLRGERPVRSVWAALAYLQLGMKEEAYAELEGGGVAASAMELVWFHPRFDDLRSEPRFQRLLESLNLVEFHARAQAWRASAGGSRRP
jgi:TolB-like protein/Flp pilus assembly protein TadD